MNVRLRLRHVASLALKTAIPALGALSWTLVRLSILLVLFGFLCKKRRSLLPALPCLTLLFSRLFTRHLEIILILSCGLFRSGLGFDLLKLRIQGWQSTLRVLLRVDHFQRLGVGFQIARGICFNGLLGIQASQARWSLKLFTI